VEWCMNVGCHPWASALAASITRHSTAYGMCRVKHSRSHSATMPALYKVITLSSWNVCEKKRRIYFNTTRKITFGISWGWTKKDMDVTRRQLKNPMDWYVNNEWQVGQVLKSAILTIVTLTRLLYSIAACSSYFRRSKCNPSHETAQT